MYFRNMGVYSVLVASLLLSAPGFARDLSPAESSLYMEATDLPWMRRDSLPQADDTGPGLGKATWVASDPEEVIGIVQELRWVFPDDATAEAWMMQNLQDLAEGMSAANAPTVGDHSFAFGPIFPGSEEIAGRPMRMINYVFRVGRVVVKFFATSMSEDPSQLTALYVSPYAVKAADRVREAQSSLAGPAVAVGGAAPVAAAAAPAPVAQESSPPAENEASTSSSNEEEHDDDDDYAVPITAYGGAYGSLFGRYMSITNLLNQPDRSAATLGVQFAFPLFSNGSDESTGFGVHDALELELDGGLRLSEEFVDSTGQSESMFAAGYGASYSLAFGYRWEPVGLLVGARPTLRGILIGDVTSGGPDIPLMALLELRPSDEVLLAVRGYYSFFFDQRMQGLMAAAFFDEEWVLRFDFDQYRMSTSVPAFTGEERIEVGRQVTSTYTLTLGGMF